MEGSYPVKLTEELEIKTFPDTLCKVLGKAGFRRYVACPKPLVS